MKRGTFVTVSPSQGQFGRHDKNQRSSARIKFHVDEQNEINKMTMLKNHLNSRNFNLNQKMIQIYKHNINF